MALRRDSFVSGVIAGAALGALLVVAISPQVRRPVMAGAGQMGNRMRKMMRRGRRAAEEMIPEEIS
jgi:hypothetical protein